MADAIRLRAPLRQVSPRAVWLWRIGALFGHALVTLVLLLLHALVPRVDIPWWGWTAYGVVAITHIVGMPMIRYRTHRWEVTETAAYTQTGWLTLERRIAPLSRIQTVDLAQGPLVRLLGLAAVSITTASSGGNISIHGLSADVAQHVVEYLTERAVAETDDAT